MVGNNREREEDKLKQQQITVSTSLFYSCPGEDHSLIASLVWGGDNPNYLDDHLNWKLKML